MQECYSADARGVAYASLAPGDRESLDGLVPADGLRERRLANIRRARRIYLARRCADLAGCVFVTRVACVPNVTWITAPAHRGRGVASALLGMAQGEFLVLTAKTRNEASRRVALRAGFREIAPEHWLWVRGMRRREG